MIKIYPNNKGELIGQIKEIQPVELKSQTKLTKLIMTIEGPTQSEDMVLSIYNCDYEDKLTPGKYAQIFYHLRMVNTRRPFLEACVDGIVFMPNEMMTSVRRKKSEKPVEEEAEKMEATV